MSEQRKRYEGGFMAYESSYDGTGVFRVSLHRTTRNGTREHLHIEVAIARSSLYCVVKALKAFADNEREQVGGMPL